MYKSKNNYKKLKTAVLKTLFYKINICLKTVW